MSTLFSRRALMAGGTALAACGTLPRFALSAEPFKLAITRRTLVVNGKAASVFGIQQPDGTAGLTLDPGQRFRVDLANEAGEDAVIHWHGMTPPYLQDGVADQDRPLIAVGKTASYDFAPRTGTHWMHSHHGLQEQRLMAAPLIVHSADDLKADMQEVVVLLHDFTFKDPAELLAGLGASAMSHAGHDMSNMGNMDMSNMDMGNMDMSGMDMGAMSGGAMAMDLNDVDYDAYLANDRTLADPLVIRTERKGRVRLRLINGATSTAFHIDLGSLTGSVIAVDGNAVQPVSARRFPMAMGQRLDILVDLPESGGAFPILAVREGGRERTGVILATPGATVAKVAEQGTTPADAVTVDFETRLAAVTPLAAKPVARTLRATLTGGMSPYVWSINGETFGQHHPFEVGLGERVVIDMVNDSMMAHPMHLHGHHFQVVGINGRSFSGAMRDTVLVPIGGKVSIAFDADNAGRWPFHCHNLLHMATGMMTEVVYA
ncbi:multicopper oxidase family protein [Dongia rigui]|uniref:Multicopper oxidase family protein n=1 Tax=Dongia rigui TaxID=940149 RepID=A0ABU5E3N3_9PROT|nr:multicopper oxidase family protein [Dongia rigui]MDY0873421.1 multicopper oxidase family protein [Dongia rigui]